MKSFSLILSTFLLVGGEPAMAQVTEQAPPVNDEDLQDYPGEDGDPPPPAEVPQDVDASTFQNTLDPYGAWVTVGGMGRVWRPYPTLVGNDFQPYVSNGHWAYTDVGWTWVSDWDWGWAPFHYGRWWLDSYYGWVWVPGYTWSPAWVSWRWGGGYIGWVPLAPYGYYYDSAYLGRTWCYVDDGHFTSERVWWHRQAPAQVHVARERTAPGGSRGGPPVGNIAKAVGTPVRMSPLASSGALPVELAKRPRPLLPPSNGTGAGALRTPGSQPSGELTRPEAIQRPDTSLSHTVQPTYQPPAVRPVQPTYQPPQTAPRPAYSLPQTAPRPSYSPPQSAPRPTYQPPQAAPRPAYSPQTAPRPSYSAPSQAPRPSYSPPAQSAPRPSMAPPAAMRPSVSVPAARPAPSGKK